MTEQDPNFYDRIVETVTYILPIILPVIALWVGYLQYRLSKRKSRVDEFDMRYAIYSHTEDFIHKIMSGWVTIQECVEFEKQVRKALFMYSEKINEFIDEVLVKGFELAELNMTLDAYKGDLELIQFTERKKLLHKKSDILKDSLELRNRLHSHFEKTLSIK